MDRRAADAFGPTIRPTTIFLGIYPERNRTTDYKADPYTLDFNNQTASDLLVARTTAKPTGSAVKLEFEHVMAKLVVNLSFRQRVDNRSRSGFGNGNRMHRSHRELFRESCRGNPGHRSKPCGDSLHGHIRQLCRHHDSRAERVPHHQRHVGERQGIYLYPPFRHRPATGQIHYGEPCAGTRQHQTGRCGHQRVGLGKRYFH